MSCEIENLHFGVFSVVNTNIILAITRTDSQLVFSFVLMCKHWQMKPSSFRQNSYPVCQDFVRVSFVLVIKQRASMILQAFSSEVVGLTPDYTAENLAQG
jgi:hypothetical protein